MENNNNNRRDFLKKAGMLIGVGVASTTISSLLNSCQTYQYVDPPPPTVIALANYPSLGAVGGIAKVNIGSTSIIVVNNGNNDYTAMDATCPHAGCTVDLPTGSITNLDCPCHHLEFSTKDGSVVKNPIGWGGGGLKQLNKPVYASGTLKIFP